MKPLTSKRVILFIVIVYTVSELLIMFLLEYIPYELNSTSEALLDSTILGLLSTPIIYYWVFKPYITERDKNLEQIRFLALHDPLTNLANRRLLFEHMDKIISTSARHNIFSALILIDIDEFKSINDNYGHDTGDTLLIEIAGRLEAITRVEDVVSRLGGDEFIIVAGQLGSTESEARNKARQIAEKIQNIICQPIEIKGHEFRMSASLGIRLIGPDKFDTKTLIKEADNAMYQVKKSGSGGIGI